MERIIELCALSNGAHRNQSFNGEVPEGWALLPQDIETLNFPYGEVEVVDVEGTKVVTCWVPGEIPETEQEKEWTESAEGTAVFVAWDELDTAYQEGVNSAYDS